MNIRISNASSEPIYLQIKNQIKGEILSGNLKEGEMLPSIRFLAKELRVSVITTKRAYDELEKEGFLHSVQGKGSFVAKQNLELIREEHLKKMEQYLKQALHYASLVEISREEFFKLIEMLQEEEDERH